MCVHTTVGWCSLQCSCEYLSRLQEFVIAQAQSSLSCAQGPQSLTGGGGGGGGGGGWSLAAAPYMCMRACVCALHVYVCTHSLCIRLPSLSHIKLEPVCEGMTHQLTIVFMRSYLQSSCNLNLTTSKDNLTPLHVAVHEGYSRMVENLVGSGANLNAITSDGGNTVLHLAISRKNMRPLSPLTPQLNKVLYITWGGGGGGPKKTLCPPRPNEPQD